MVSTHSKMFQKIKDAEYRSLLNARQIRRMLPLQIKSLRTSRDMKQEDLARVVGTTQTVISRIEREKGNLTIGTMLKIAEALDVMLVVRFEPVDKFMDWMDDLSPDALSPDKSEKILDEMEKEEMEAE